MVAWRRQQQTHLGARKHRAATEPMKEHTMKHHLFALAGAVATVALASDPSLRTGDLAIDGFENYTAGQAVTAGSAAWSGTAEATVTAYESGEAPTGIAFPQPFTNAGDNYLAIDSGNEEVTNDRVSSVEASSMRSSS